MTDVTMNVTTWHGCYDDSWRDLIVDDAFAHPAKFAPGLIKRIYQHGFERGWWERGSVVGDCFGGVGCGGVIACGMGLRHISVELEPRFIELAERNFDKCARFGVRPMILQGDSRAFASLVGAVDSIVTSPPWADQMHEGGDTDTARGIGRSNRGHGPHSHTLAADYGSTPGQIGAMKPGKLDAICTSPPYADSVKGDHGETETAGESRAARNTPGGSLGQSQRHGGYGCSDGNIGNLKEGKLTGIVTSPPWEGNDTHLGTHGDTLGQRQQIEGGSSRRGADGYGDAPGQIATDTGGTYWKACAQVYQQCRLALKPGGMLVVVVKAYVKNGKRVPLPDQTLALLESLGFQLVERIHAMLVKESTEPGLFGDVTKRKQKKSFFRLLAEKKGAPPIDWEEVLCVRA